MMMPGHVAESAALMYEVNQNNSISVSVAEQVLGVQNKFLRSHKKAILTLRLWCVKHLHY